MQPLLLAGRELGVVVQAAEEDEELIEQDAVVRHAKNAELGEGVDENGDEQARAQQPHLRVGLLHEGPDGEAQLEHGNGEAHQPQVQQHLDEGVVGHLGGVGVHALEIFAVANTHEAVAQQWLAGQGLGEQRVPEGQPAGHAQHFFQPALLDEEQRYQRHHAQQHGHISGPLNTRVARLPNVKEQYQHKPHQRRARPGEHQRQQQQPDFNHREHRAVVALQVKHQAGNAHHTQHTQLVGVHEVAAQAGLLAAVGEAVKHVGGHQRAHQKHQ